jgi:hypothetical protein
MGKLRGKWKTFYNKPRSYSDSVKYSANEWPAKLPTQENRNDTRNFPIPSKDTEQSVQIVNTIPGDSLCSLTKHSTEQVGVIICHMSFDFMDLFS